MTLGVRFRLIKTGDPDGQIEVGRLGEFARRFQTATFRSAQAALNIPAYRRNLGDEPRPQYRLTALGEGSVTLTVEAVDDRAVSAEAVTRHLEGLVDYRRTGRWPSHIYLGERQAWAELYRSVVRHDDSVAEVAWNGADPLRVDNVAVAAMAQEPTEPTFSRITCIGDLHMIEVERNPRFRINTEEIDLVFDLADDILVRIDPLRWRRVRAEALWEQGTNRARLIGGIEETDEPAGVTVLGEVAVPSWVTNQLERITRLAGLPAWSVAPGIPKIRKSAADVAAELTRRINEQFGDRVPPDHGPFFAPNHEGNLEFEWQIGDRFLLCEIVPAGYHVLATEGNNVLWDGEVRHKELFDWIDWVLGGTRPSEG